MYTRNSDRYSLIEAYNNIRECECQAAMHSPLNASLADDNEEKIDMVLNNLVNINNKSAELVKSIQNAINANQDIEQWVTEKIAVVADTISNLTDYYVKYKDVAPASNNTNIQANMPSTASLKLEPMTVAASFPLNTNMPPMVTSF
jgi:hypothetical protein